MKTPNPNTPTARVIIKGESYTITNLGGGSYRLLKDGAAPPGYLVKSPNSCTCQSWESPCKHLRAVEPLEAQREATAAAARLEVLEKELEEALREAESARTPAALEIAQKAHRRWVLEQEFK